MHRLILVILMGSAAYGQDAYPPGTFQFNPQVDLQLQPVQVVVPDKYAERIPDQPVLNLPPGFSARVFAIPGGPGRPRLMAFNADGVLHVAHVNSVMALPDRDNDGVADAEITAVSGLSQANSIAFYRDAMYVAETDKVIRYRDPDGDLVYEEREILVNDIPSEGWHTSRTIAIDAINERFYIAVGSPCDLCRLEQPVYGYSEDPIAKSDEWDAILEFNMDGSGRRIFATGMRNAVGLDIHPATNELWATHNHFDLGGADLPPEWIDIVRNGDFMGYPLSYGYQVWVDEKVENYQRIWPYTQADSLRVQRMKKPAGLVEAHQAPLGMFFYDHPLFPDRFRHAAFIALHGGLTGGNLSVVPGFKVVALFDTPGDGQAQMADFLTGFGPPHTQVWGKPVGITADPQGRLYVSSDAGSPAVFRIEPTVIQGSWQHSLPTIVASGGSLQLQATIHVERFDPEGETPVVTADLSAFGGSAAQPLTPDVNGDYRLEEILAVERSNGQAEVIVWIRQRNDAGLHSVKLIHAVTIAPVSDAVIFADRPTLGWTLEHSNLIQLQTTELDGATAIALTATPSRLAGWNIEFKIDQPFLKDGYKSLRFAFHPGDIADTDSGTFQIRINQRSVGNRTHTGHYTLDREFGKLVNLLGEGVGGVAGYEVDLTRREWQVVEIPLDILQPEGAIELIRFSGNIAGTFYLDDLRLITSVPPPTLVTEEYQATAPTTLALENNRPNPFNSNTVIHYQLPETGQIELAIYNLAGQQVAQLVRDLRPAGRHAVHWDGRNDQGQALASGVYLYRLRAGDSVQVRKLLLLK